MKTVCLTTAYLAPVQYYCKLLAYDRAVVEQYDHYAKQTYRNRCVIAAPDGPLALTIPTVKPDNPKCPVRDIRIPDTLRPWLERALMTGITRVSRESIFSDLNHLEVVTTTTEKYEECFGFTETEVFAAMAECGYENQAEVKRWYDGFVFGRKRDIYNPWSILNYLDKGKLAPYWANTSSNSLVGKLIREGSKNIKVSFEQLLAGKSIRTTIDEQIVYDQLNHVFHARLVILPRFLVIRIITPVKILLEILQHLDLCHHFHRIACVPRK